MAREMWDKPIDRTVDWNGCQSTGNLPVSGKYVQKFLRETLDEKIGYVGLNEYARIYVVTRDEESYRKYMATVSESKPGGDKSIDGYIADFQAPFEYTAMVDFSKPETGFVAMLKGETGATIQFTPSTKSSDGSSYDELYSYTVTFRNGGFTQTFNGRTNEIGKSVTMNVDKFISLGSNNVSVVVTGLDTGASAYKAVEFKVIEMMLKDRFDIGHVYDLSKNSTPMDIDYEVKSIGKTTIYFIVDGKEAGKQIGDNFNTTDGKYSIMLSHTDPAMTQGVHTLRFYMECFDGISGETFRTPIYERTFFVYKGEEQIQPMIGISLSYPYDRSIIESNKPGMVAGVKQYEPYPLNFSVYHKGRKSVLAHLYMKMADENEFTEVGKYETKNEETYIHDIYSVKDGMARFKIEADGSKIELGPFPIEQSKMDIEPVENNLSLYLDAYGRSNSETEKEKWEFTDAFGNNYKATFNGFSWNDPYGWYDNKLVIGNGMSVDINMKPFESKDKIAAGCTFEFEFSTSGVYDDNAEVCRICSPEGYPGIIITATEAKYVINSTKTDKKGYSEEVSTKFKSGENNRISFVITPKGAPDNRGRFVKVYVNGIICGAITYDENAILNNNSSITFKGTDKAEIELSSIRFYSSALNNDEILNNYIFFRKNPDERIKLYNKNNIYDSNSQISMDLVKQQLPVMLFKQRMKDGKVEGRIEDIETEYANKKKTVHFDIEYEDMQNPKFNFTCERARIRPQGTSSMKYPKKNFRIYTGKEKDSVFRNYKGDIIKKGKYSFKKNAMPVNCWCLKADFAESSSTHNTGVARLWNTVLKAGGLLTKAQANAIEYGVKDDVRTTVDGFPILLFYQEIGGRPRFIGKYNFNNDKSTEDVYGFTGGPEIENQEVKYFRVGHDEPIIQLDDGEPCCTMGEYVESPSTRSPLYAYKNLPNGKKEYYMLRGKELFDNPRMECWEFTDSASKVALFTTTVGFSTNYKASDKINEFVGRYYTAHIEETGQDQEIWEGGFESRFPDCGEYYHTSNLRDLCEWITSTRYLKVNDVDGSSIPMTTEEVHNLADIENKGNGRPLSQELTIQSLTKRDGFKEFKYTPQEGGEPVIYNFWEKVTLPNTPENRKLKFQIEKWDHFEMDKIAAYYIYLMRFGGVDQTVKNAMFATEGSDDNTNPELPSKWYFINYDNDTVLGVKNDGHLVFDPYITRQTREPNGSYVYAGRESTLWNNLEEDAEFMSVVKKIDAQLTSSHDGLSYKNAIHMFNDLQSGKWCERIYNMDAQYKYIDSYVSPTPEAVEAGQGNENYLFDVQGSRSAHRKWWLSKRFNIFDSKFVTGDFLKNAILFKINGTKKLLNVIVTSGESIHYGIRGNSNTLDWVTPDVIEPGHICKLPVTEGTQVGTPLSVLGATNIQKIDLTEFGNTISMLKLGGAHTADLGTKLVEVKLGDHNKPFVNEFNEWSGSMADGLQFLSKLEVLDYTGFRTMPGVDSLKSLGALREIYLADTAISALEFAKGGNITTMHLPQGLKNLILDTLPLLTYDGIKFKKLEQQEDGSYKEVDANNYGELLNLQIKDCPHLMTDPTFIFNWLKDIKSRGINMQNVVVNVGEVDWTLGSVEELSILSDVLAAGGKIKITGTIRIDKMLSKDEVKFLQNIFGPRCFDSISDIRILANMAVYIVGPSSILEGSEKSEYNFSLVNMDSDGEFNITLKDNNGRFADGENVIFDVNSNHKNATIKVNENNLHIEFLHLLFEYTRAGKITRDIERIDLIKRKYPDLSVISGPLELSDTKKYAYNIELSRADKEIIDGFYEVEWVLGGDASLPGEDGTPAIKIVSENTNESMCTLFLQKYFDGYATLGANVYQKFDHKKIILSESNSIDIYLTDPSTLFAPTKNKPMYDLFKKNGLIREGANKFTISDAWNIKESDLAPGGEIINGQYIGGTSIFKGNKDITSFDEFEHFLGITKIGNDWFNGCTSLRSIKFSTGILYVGEKAFWGCESLEEVSILSTQKIYEYAFAFCRNLKKAKFGPGTEIICSNSFEGCTNLDVFEIPESLSDIGDSNITSPFIDCPNVKFYGKSKIFYSEFGNLLKKSDGVKVEIIKLGKDSRIEDLSPDNSYEAKAYSFEYYNSPDGATIGSNIKLGGDHIFYKSSSPFINITTNFLSNIRYDYLFDKCTCQSYQFSSSETIIPRYCFNEVTLDEYTVPDTITNIYENAFEKCTIKKITIGKSVAYINNNAFRATYSLKDIIMKPTIPPEIGKNNFYGTALERVLVSGNSIEDYFKKGGFITMFLVPYDLPETGFVKIIKDGKFPTGLVQVGGVQAIQTEDGMFKYNSQPNNKNMEIFLDGVKVGDVLRKCTNIYLGDNSSLYVNDNTSFDFTRDSYNKELVTNEKGWYFDKINCGLRSNNFENGNTEIKIKFGPIPEDIVIRMVQWSEYSDYVYIKNELGDTIFELKNNKKSEEIEIELKDVSNLLTIGFSKDTSVEEGIDGVIIKSINYPSYNEPIYDVDSPSNLLINVTSTIKLENPIYITLNDSENNFCITRKWSGSTEKIKLPKNKIWKIHTNDFITKKGKYFESIVKEFDSSTDGSLSIDFISKTGYNLDNGIIFIGTNEQDFWIKRDKIGPFVWSSENNSMPEVETENPSLKETDGLVLSKRVLDSESNNILFNRANNISGFGDKYTTYIPSWYEINIVKDTLFENGYNVSDLWVSDSKDSNNSWNSEALACGKQELKETYVFGRRIKK